MISMILLNTVVPFFATLAYAVLFNVPKRHYFACGLIGMICWMTYAFSCQYSSPVVSTLAATLVVVFVSRWMSVRQKCPLTIFLVSGIIPVVPGVGIYYTAYYLVVGKLDQAAIRGLEAVKAAFAIVLGIVLVVAIPKEMFQLSHWRKRKFVKNSDITEKVE